MKRWMISSVFKKTEYSIFVILLILLISLVYAETTTVVTKTDLGSCKQCVSGCCPKETTPCTPKWTCKDNSCDNGCGQSFTLDSSGSVTNTGTGSDSGSTSTTDTGGTGGGGTGGNGDSKCKDDKDCPKNLPACFEGKCHECKPSDEDSLGYKYCMKLYKDKRPFCIISETHEPNSGISPAAILEPADTIQEYVCSECTWKAEDYQCPKGEICNYVGPKNMGSLKCIIGECEFDKDCFIYSDYIPKICEHGRCIQAKCLDSKDCDANLEDCVAGRCEPKNPKECWPSCGQCKECNKDTGKCNSHPGLDLVPCDDKNIYTYNDRCYNGKCIGIFKYDENPKTPELRPTA